MAQTVTIGVDKLYYALKTANTDTATVAPAYGTIYPLPNVSEISLTKGGNVSKLRGDNVNAFAANGIGDLSLSLKVADIEPDDRARLFGQTYSAGVIVEAADDVSPEVAIMFRRLRHNGTYEYVTLPKVVFAVDDDMSMTKADTVEWQTPTLVGTALSLQYTGGYEVKSRSDDTLASAAQQAAWFSTVVYDATVDTGAVSVAIAVASLTTTFTFTKSGGGNITLTQANLTQNTLPIFKSDTVVPGAYVITNNGTATVTVTFTPTVAYGTATVIANVPYRSVYDQNGVYATLASKSLSY